MTQKRDINFLEKKGLIFSPPIILGIVAKDVNSRNEIQEDDFIMTENVEVLMQKAMKQERELEQRQLQISKLTSDYEKQRMEAFELEQKLVLLNEENMKYRQSLQQGNKIVEKSQEQEVIHKQQLLQIKSEQDIKDKLLKSQSDNHILNSKLIATEETFITYERQIQEIQAQKQQQVNALQQLLEDKQNYFEKERKLQREEIERITLEKQDIFIEFQNKVRNLEIENASLRENASQAQQINGNQVIQLKNQVNTLLEQLKTLQQEKSQTEHQNLLYSRNSNLTLSQLQQDIEKIYNEKVALSDEVQNLQCSQRKTMQDIEDLQCERSGLLKENENMIIYLNEKNAAYENLNKIYNDCLNKNEYQLQEVLQQQQIQINQLQDNHNIQLTQIQQNIISLQNQKGQILQKINDLQDALINTNKQGISAELQQQLFNHYQQLLIIINPNNNVSDIQHLQQNLKQIEQENKNNNNNNNNNYNDLMIQVEEKCIEVARLQNLCDQLQDEVNTMKQQNVVEEHVKRQKKHSQSDNDTTQDINVSPTHPHTIKGSQSDNSNLNQMVVNLRKQIQEVEEKLSQEIESNNAYQIENDKLRLSIQRYEMMGHAAAAAGGGRIQMQNITIENNYNIENQSIKQDASFNNQEDNSEMFEVSRYLQEEVTRLKGLLDGQKHEQYDNNNIMINPMLRNQKPENQQDIINQCIYEEQNEQSQSEQSNQHNSVICIQNGSGGNVQDQCQTCDHFQRSDIDSSNDQRLCFSFQDQVVHLNDQIRRAEGEVDSCHNKMQQQEQLIREQNAIINKNNTLIEKFQENLKESENEMQTSYEKNKELETSVINYQNQLQQYVEQMHKNIEQLGQYEHVIKLLENEVADKNISLQQDQEAIHNLTQQLNQLTVQFTNLTIEKDQHQQTYMQFIAKQQQQQQQQQQEIEEQDNQDYETVKRSSNKNDSHILNQPSQINEQTSQIKEQASQINELTQQINELTSQINEQSIQIEQYRETMNNYQVQINNLEYNNAVASQLNIAQSKQISNLKEQQKHILVQIFSNSHQNEKIQLFLNSEQPWQEMYGDEIQHELEEFMHNIGQLKNEIKEGKEQQISQQVMHSELQDEYLSLQQKFNAITQDQQHTLSSNTSQNSSLQAQNDQYRLEILKLNDYVEQIEVKMNQDRQQIEELEKKACNLINLEKVQSDIISQQQKKDKQQNEQIDNQLKTIQQLKDSLSNQTKLNSSLQNNINETEKIKELEMQIKELEQQIQNLQQNLVISEQSKMQGQMLMEETSNLIDNLNEEIQNYKSQLDQQQEIIFQETQKLDNLQNDYHQQSIVQKNTIEAQNQLIQNLESQIQSQKQMETNPLQQAVDQIQHVLLSKTKELEKCQSLISNLQSQEKSSYEIIKQQEVFLLEFQKIKRQHQLEKEQNQKVIISLQHSLDKSQKEAAMHDSTNKVVTSKLTEVKQELELIQSSYHQQIKLNTELQMSLNQVRSRENSQILIQNQESTLQNGQTITSSIKLEQQDQKQSQQCKQSDQIMQGDDFQIDYKQQYEELKQILEDQNYLDTLNKYAKQVNHTN